MINKRKIAVVNSHPIQYFAPLYAYLSRSDQIEVTALYCSDASLRGGMDPGFKREVKWDVDLLSGYRPVFLGARAKQRVPGGFFSLVCPEVWSEIVKGDFDALWIHGYAHAVNVIAVLAAKYKGIPVFVRSETHLGLQRSGWKRVVRDGMLRVAYKFVDGFLAIGSGNRKYYESLGIAPSRIFDVPYAVDNERFIQSAMLSADERDAVRAKYGLDQSLPVVVYASKFIQRKHPDDLVEAFSVLQREGLSASLLLVGTGEMEIELRAKVKAANLRNVVFAGFANQSELPRIFGASDVFVLPSENEPWGLIVNEAMCAGIPVIVSEEVGCVQDLVEDGVNGCRMRAGDVGSLVAAMRTILQDEVRRKLMGEHARERISQWSYEQCRVGVLRSLAPAGEVSR